jgi:hypothetical protein
MVKTHPDAHGTEKMVAFRLSGGNVPDAVEGRLLLESIEKQGVHDYSVDG